MSHLPYESPAAEYRPALHVAAVATLCLTFPLIFLGGLVTSHGAGMSVPDWPNSYGYNMFLFPPNRWVGGIFYEHTHRLLGTVVGFSAIILASVAWGPGRTAIARRVIVCTVAAIELANAAGTGAMILFPDRFHLTAASRSTSAILPHGVVTAIGFALVAIVVWASRQPEPRRWVRWLAAAVLIAVCIQGVIGGLRVDLINLPLAMVHGCFAQATFCLMVITAAVTGRAWRRLPAQATAPAGRVTIAAYMTVAVILAQLIVAAVMRHLGAGLAIPDLPLAYGHYLPPMNAAQLAIANHTRIWDLGLPKVTLGQVWLHFAHRVGAVIVSTAVIGLVSLILVRHRRRRSLVNPALALAVLLVTQVTLGVFTVLKRKPADIASSHVACGALVLATAVLIAVRASRLYVLRSRVPSPDVTAGERVAV